MARELDQEQLSLEVGGGMLPRGASFKISGKLAVADELMRGDQVMISLINEDGELVVAGHGYVRGIAFVTHKPKDAPEWVERVHTIKLD